MTKLRGLIVLVLLSLVLLGAPGLAQDFEPGKNTVMVPMKDGVGLATDIWLPEGDGPWPVVMARTPYDKNPTAGGEFNANGMALVVQDVRGRFASEGEARPFVDDGWGKNRDGRDTAKWIVAQQWCNGEIATFGASALGMTQYLLAGNNPRGLVACYPVVACASMYHNGFYEGGAFRQALVEPWLEATGWPEYALEDSLSHPRYDALWKAIDLNTRARRVRVPMMHVGGWHDVFTQGTVDAFMALQYGGGKGARGRQHLIMGPWPHGIKTTKVGELAYPENAVWPEGAPEEMAWISAFLLSGGAGMDELPTVWYYVMGDVDAEDAPGNQWRTADAWPPSATQTRLYFTSRGGLVDSQPAAGKLGYEYDPDDPVPTVGGRNLSIPGGSLDQRKVEERDDVLVFTTDELTQPMEITGRVGVELNAASSARDTDWTAKLTDVYPDGRSMLISDGILRARFRQSFAKEVLLERGRTYEYSIDLGSTSIIINAGHRLRVTISSSNAPRYDPNPNTGAPLRADDETEIAEQTIHVGGGKASCIVLPVVE